MTTPFSTVPFNGLAVGLLSILVSNLGPRLTQHAASFLESPCGPVVASGSSAPCDPPGYPILGLRALALSSLEDPLAREAFAPLTLSSPLDQPSFITD